jgi:hypothetical protein
MSQKKPPKKQTREAPKLVTESKSPPKRTLPAELLFPVEVAPTSVKDKTQPPQQPTVKTPSKTPSKKSS